MYDHSRRTLMIASLAVLATFLDTTILFVAFPDITATFSGTSASELSWVLNAYTIVFAAMLIPAGKLADRVGHRQGLPGRLDRVHRGVRWRAGWRRRPSC